MPDPLSCHTLGLPIQTGRQSLPLSQLDIRPRPAKGLSRTEAVGNLGKVRCTEDPYQRSARMWQVPKANGVQAKGSVSTTSTEFPGRPYELPYCCRARDPTRRGGKRQAFVQNPEPLTEQEAAPAVGGGAAPTQSRQEAPTGLPTRAGDPQGGQSWREP